MDWRAATGVGANDGGLTLWIDNIQQATLTGVDNDTRRIDRVRLGALTGITPARAESTTSMPSSRADRTTLGRDLVYLGINKPFAVMDKAILHGRHKS
ncbi:MAG: hypothetical protein ACXW4Q_11945 [Anaerolineales bacterium]